MIHRDLTQEEKAELFALNQAVKQAIARRTRWLDNKMVEISKFKVGDDMYNENGYSAGKVEELCRWHRGSGEYDTSCDFYIRFGGGSNTSVDRRWFGTKEDVLARKRQQLEYLKKELETP
jgi:hypothetical protein